MDRPLADARARAVILVHDDWNVGPFFNSRFDQMAKEWSTGVLTSTCRGLHDHGAVSLVRRFHDRPNLLEVVDVEGGDAVIVLGRVVE